MMRRAVVSTLAFLIGVFGILVTNRPDYSSPATLENSKDQEVLNSDTETLDPNAETPATEPQNSITPSPKTTVADLSESKPTFPASQTVSPSSSPAVVTKRIIDGDVVSAGKYGSVQVQISVIDGVVVSAKALIFPDADSRSLSISNMAIPILVDQTIEAINSSDIQGATGASYTSSAWIESLQSALATL
jgi:uncharacterized protein with FMN-binding domain